MLVLHSWKHLSFIMLLSRFRARTYALHRRLEQPYRSECVRCKTTVQTDCVTFGSLHLSWATCVEETCLRSAVCLTLRVCATSVVTCRVELDRRVLSGTCDRRSAHSAETRPQRVDRCSSKWVLYVSFGLAYSLFSLLGFFVLSFHEHRRLICFFIGSIIGSISLAASVFHYELPNSLALAF